MKTPTVASWLALFGLLIVGGYLWRQAYRSAADRAEYVSDSTFSDDDTVGVSLVAGGFSNRDVVVSAYVLGEEDRSTEDFWVEDLAHGSPAAEFYRQGFRRIVTYDSKNTLSRTILIAPPAVIQNEPQVAGLY